MRIAKNVIETALLAGLLMPASARCAAVNAHCTDGVELRLSAPQASQGSLILATVRSQKAMREVTGKWNERDVYFWEGSSTTAAHRSTHNHVNEALLGVDLEKAPGDYEFLVSATMENGEQAECTATLVVRAGKFATESLTVKQQFVEPNEQQAQRAVAEQEKLKQIFDHITPEKLWHGSVPASPRRRGARNKFREAPHPEWKAAFAAHGGGFSGSDGNADSRDAKWPGGSGRGALFFGKHRHYRSWIRDLFAIWPFIGD